MPIPKCPKCGVNYGSNAYNGFCAECYRKGQREVAIVGIVVFLVILFLVSGAAAAIFR